MRPGSPAHLPEEGCFWRQATPIPSRADAVWPRPPHREEAPFGRSWATQHWGRLRLRDKLTATLILRRGAGRHVQPAPSVRCAAPTSHPSFNRTAHGNQGVGGKQPHRGRSHGRDGKTFSGEPISR